MLGSILSPLDGFRSPFGPQRGFNPRTLFGPTDIGWVYDLYDMSTLFQDAAGTIPVTDVNQPVGLCLDKSKGLVLGPELVTNGTFDTDTAWTKGVGVTIAGGVATYSGAATNADLVTQNISVVSGRTYAVTYTVSALTGGLSSRIGNVNGVFYTTAGTRTEYIVAGATGSVAVGILGRGAGVSAATIDNISVRELPGNHRSQSASLPRPTYARHPLGGIRNLLLNTGFDGAVSGSPGTAPTSWTRFIGATGGTSTYTAGAGSLGGGSLRISVSADRHQIGQAINVAANTTYVLSAIVDITTPTGLTQILDWVNPPAGSTFAWRVNGGAIITNGNTVPSAGNNQLIEAILTVSATAGTANARFGVGIQANVTGDVTFRDIQVDVASVRSAYQRVVSAFDVTEAGQPDLYYLSYDGSDDRLSTSAFAWGSDKATVVAGVRKLSDAASGVLAELSTDSETTNGSIGLAVPGSSTRFIAISRGTATQTASTTNAAYNAPTTRVVTVLSSIAPANLVLRLDGMQVGANTVTQGNGNFGTHQAFFGARAGTSAFFNGREYSNFAINRLLTANELSQIERYTAQRTGVTIP